jgi:hypothetical protein
MREVKSNQPFTCNCNSDSRWVVNQIDVEAAIDSKTLTQRPQRPRSLSLPPTRRRICLRVAGGLRPAFWRRPHGKMPEMKTSGQAWSWHFPVRPAPKCCSAKRCAGESQAESRAVPEPRRFPLRSLRSQRTLRWAFYHPGSCPFHNHRLLTHCPNWSTCNSSTLEPEFRADVRPKGLLI